jgi:hypothetical protein
MSIQILLEPASIINKSLDLYCNSINANEINGNTFPTAALPDGKSIIIGNGVNDSFGYAVSPYKLLNESFTFNIAVGGTEIAGGNTPIALGSSSTLQYGNDIKYDYKVVGLMTNTQPFTSYYLQIGGITINEIANVDQSAIGTPLYMEISGSFIIRNGFPLASDITSCMTVKFSTQYVPVFLPVLPVAPTELNSATFVNAVNLGVLPKYAIVMASPAGTTTFTSYVSSLTCSFSNVI